VNSVQTEKKGKKNKKLFWKKKKKGKKNKKLLSRYIHPEYLALAVSFHNKQKTLMVVLLPSSQS
jgi:hypothetical protein